MKKIIITISVIFFFAFNAKSEVRKTSTKGNSFSLEIKDNKIFVNGKEFSEATIKKLAKEWIRTTNTISEADKKILLKEIDKKDSDIDLNISTDENGNIKFSIKK